MELEMDKISWVNSLTLTYRRLFSIFGELGGPLLPEQQKILNNDIGENIRAFTTAISVVFNATARSPSLNHTRFSGSKVMPMVLELLKNVVLYVIVPQKYIY